MFVNGSGQIDTIGWAAVHNYQEALNPYIKMGRGVSASGTKSGMWWDSSDPDLNDPHLWGSFTNNGLFTGVLRNEASVVAPASSIYATLRQDNWRSLTGAPAAPSKPADDHEFYDMCLDPWNDSDAASPYYYTKGRVVPPKSLFPSDPDAQEWEAQINKVRYFDSTVFLYADGHAKSAKFASTYRSPFDNDWDVF